MSDQPSERARELAERRELDTAAYKEAVEAQKTEEVEPQDVGYAETLRGQIEVIAGSVEHLQLLNAHNNVTSYGGDVNVIVAPLPPEPEPEPPAESGQWQEEQR